MTESKITIITIRISEEEKALVAKEAKKLNITVSQYVRYKALDEHSIKADEQKTTSEFLEKHMTMLSRIIIDGYFHIKALSLESLTEEERDEALQLTYKKIDKMGIAMWKEEYGEKTLKIKK